MIKKLIIKNIALIDNAEINFIKGLNVLSGETGSGKSVIIDSLNFVLGAKADKTLIRSGENECLVKAEFDVSDCFAILNVYDEFDFEREDVLIISRKFTVDGKNSIKINGNTATVSMLKKFTALLVDVHGQSDHFNLLKNSNQLDLIDKFGGEELLTLKGLIKQDYCKIKEIKKELENLGGDESQRLIRLDILNYQINEIENSNIYENEEEELLTAKQKINHQELILSALNAVKSSINDEGGISDILGNTNRLLSSVSGFDQEYQILYERVESLFAELDDVGSKASDLIDELDVSDYNPYVIEDRLELIKALKSKYGGSYENIMKFLQTAQEEKEKLENCNILVDNLTSEIQVAKKSLYMKYSQLTDMRKEIAQQFSNKTLLELKELGMSKANFNIAFNSQTEGECRFDSDNGVDSIEFEFSANLGEPLKPLSLIISGGEISRFMLAIKAQTAKYNDVSTFIFDEIDAGISGNIAKVVSEKFAKIAKDKQIIAITHLPQISAMADNNILIEKNEVNSKTITQVKVLDADQKVLEIVRLVGGSAESSVAIDHAKELIAKADEYKSII